MNTEAQYVIFATKDLEEYLSAAQKRQLNTISNVIGKKRKERNIEPIKGIFVDEDSEEFDAVFLMVLGKKALLQLKKENKTEDFAPAVVVEEMPIKKYNSPFRRTNPTD